MYIFVEVVLSKPKYCNSLLLLQFLKSLNFQHLISLCWRLMQSKFCYFSQFSYILYYGW